MFQIIHFHRILEGQCLNKNGLTAPLYILLGIDSLRKDCFVDSEKLQCLNVIVFISITSCVAKIKSKNKVYN